MVKGLRILILLSAISILAPWTAYAQDPEPILILVCGRKGIVDKTGKKIEGVTVTVKKNGSTVKSASTRSNGKYDNIELEFGHVYEVSISKPGYVTKTVIIDSDKGYFPEDILNPKTEMIFETEMISEQPDVDFSVITKSAVAKAHIDPATGQMDWDMGFISKRGNEIQKFLDNLGKKEEENEKKFNDLMASGDKSFGKEEYEAALKSYQAAQKIKPDDPDVQTKIADSENKIEALKAQAEMLAKFNEKIKEGDQLVAAGKFDEGIKKYTDAKGIKPDDKLPDEKIEEANRLKADAEKNAIDKQYADKMKEASSAFASKDYENAKKLYGEAAGIKPEEKEPKDKIKEIEDILAKQSQYDALIKDADAKFAAKDWENSKAKYEEAIKLISEQYPKDQIVKIDAELQKMADQQAKKDEYDKLIAKADGDFDSEKWESAKSNYEAALKILDEQYPKDRLTAIAAKLAEAEEERKKQEEFDQLMAKADEHFKNNEWEQAKTAYNNAKTIKDDPTIASRIIEIDQKIEEQKQAEAAEAAEAEKRKEYDQLMATAQGQFDSKDWEAAKKSYNDALALYDEKEPKDQLAKIEGEIQKEKDAAAAEAAEVEKRAKYDQLLATAKGQFDSKDWEAAKKSYQDALALYDEQEPKDGIASIEAAIQAEKDAAAAEAEEAAKRAKYDQLLAKAKGQFDSKDWEGARKSYQDALALYDEQEPKDGIAAIDAAILAEKDAAAAKKEAEKRQQYEQLLSEGKSQFDAKNWDGARKSYQDALALYDEQEPKDQLAAIEAAIQAEKDQAAADAEAAQVLAAYKAKIAEADAARDAAGDGPTINAAIELYKEANAIKSDEQYPADEVAKLQEKLDQLEGAQKAYEKLINVANTKFDGGDYEKAKELFVRAQGMRPDDPYPPQKLEEIEQKIQELKDSEAAEAAEAAKRAKYEELIRTADGAFDSKSWDAAKSSYSEALGLYPDEAHPKDRLAAIEAAIQAEKDAAAANAEEAAKRAKYDAFIEQGNTAFNSKAWDAAKTAYNKALGLYDEQYPKDQLAAIEAAIQAEKDAQAGAAQVLADYQAKIKEADAARDVANDGPGINQAIALYKEANAIKSDETYPAEEVAKLQERLNELESAKAAYDKLISVADTKRDAADYEKALQLYNRAKGMKPDDPYPPAEIAKIEQILKNQDAENALLAQYQAKIKQADAARDKAGKNGEKIQQAIELYKEANAIKSDETYPAEEVSKLQDLLNKLKDGEAAYNKLIAAADKNFESENYEKAKGLYVRAKGIRPDDAYPPDQIRRINQLLRDQAGKDAQIAQFQELIKKADGEFNEESYSKALGTYEDALDVIPGSQYPTKQIEKIKDILNQMAEDKAAKELEQKRTEVFNADEFYGEDITGKYTDRELDKVFKDDQIDHVDWRDEELEKEKTAEIAFNEELTENSRELSDENFQMYEEYKQNLADEEVSRDIPRQEIVEEVEAYRDTREEQSMEEYERFSDRNFETYQQAREYEEATADNHYEAVRAREVNAEAYENYKDELRDWDADNKETEKLRSEEVYANNEDYREFQQQETKSSIDRRDETANAQIEDRISVEEWTGAMSSADDIRDYEQHQYQEQVKEDLAEFYDEGDKRRDGFVSEMEAYKDKEADLQKTQEQTNTDRTYQTHQEVEEDKLDRDEFEASLDEPRQKYADEYEEYKDKLADGQKTLDSDGESRTYQTHEQVEQGRTERAEFESSLDEPRQKYAEDYEEYKDKLAEGERGLDSDGEDRTYSQHIAAENFRTKVDNQFKDADIQRQKSADAVTRYQDNMYNEQAEKKADLDDVYDDRREQYEENDNISDTKFSEDNYNALAKEYGPGVHEKVYQQKDNRGNIIRITVIRVVVNGNKGYEYKFIKTRFGEQYFKDGKAITAAIWDTETNRPSE